MNNQRRKALDKAVSDLETIIETITGAQEEEQEYLDVMPESLQAGDKGDAAQDALDLFEQALDALQTVIEHLGNATH